MPKASLNPDKARSGGGVEAGNYEITAAKFQNLKTDYKPNQLNLVLEVQTLDKDGDRVRGADPITIYFGFGEKSIEAFHPGVAKDIDDKNAVDQGDAVDAEGPTVYCVGEDQFNRSCGALVFMDTLVKAGFPKLVLDQCWAPAFVGMKFTLATLSSIDVNKKFGTRLNTKPTADGGQFTYKVCDKWLNPSYLGKSAKRAAVAAVEAEAAEEMAASNGNVAGTAEEITKHVLTLLAAKKPGEKNTIKTKQSLVGFFTNEFTKSKQPQKLLTQCQDLIKNDDWAGDAVAELGGIYTEGRVTFPEA